mmetsp:Transcript_6815/g.14880  ORF Transcript_6815/g.14880 Transcript_6815/m.14880 type:complete len:349 (-) Transcript_6815:135-1181(-)
MPPHRTCLAVLLLSVCPCSSFVVDAFSLPIQQSSPGRNAPFAAKGPASSMSPVTATGFRSRLPVLLQSTRADVVEAVRGAASTRSSRRSKQKQGVDNRSTDTDMIQMAFLGEKTVTTSPVPLPPSTSKQQRLSLLEFFLNEKHRNLLFFRNDVETISSPTRDMLETWSSELKLGGGMELDDDGNTCKLGPTESIIQIKTALTMPGLNILTINTIGTKLLLNAADNMPEYQFTLLESELIPDGAAPLVWLFNKLIRFRDTTSSFTRVRAKNAGGVNCDKIVFTTEARLETRIQVPKKAMKAMPGVNAERFERQGSKSIHKLLEKELEPALLEFRSAYIRWVETSDMYEQ